MKAGSVIVALLLTIGALYGLYRWAGPGTEIDEKLGGAKAETSKEGFKPPEISKTGPHPKAVTEELEHYFGIMELGASGKHTFEIVNEGEAPLVLAQGETSCKCTISNVSDGDIPPGKSAQITLEWTPSDEADVFEQQANIFTNDPENRLLEFRVVGQVRTLVKVHPPDGLNLGRMEGNKPLRGVARIYSDVLDEFQITDTETYSDKLHVETVPIPENQLREQAAKSGYEIRIRLDPGFPIGKFNTEVKFKTDKTPNNDSYLELTAERTGPFRLFTPPEVSWDHRDQTLVLGRFNASEGKTVECNLSIAGKLDEPAVFENVVGEPSYVQGKIELDEKRSAPGRPMYRLTVTVPKDIASVAHSSESPAYLRAKSNHPDVEDFEIRLQFVAF